MVRGLGDEVSCLGEGMDGWCEGSRRCVGVDTYFFVNHGVIILVWY